MLQRKKTTMDSVFCKDFSAGDMSMETPINGSKHASGKPTTDSEPQTPNPPDSSSSPHPLSVRRQWRLHAQRNVRNQWSKLASYRKQWATSSSNGRSHATSLVNAHLLERSMPTMELYELADMDNIRVKASEKLVKRQELYRRELLSAYKDMVGVVSHMVQAVSSLRSFLREASGSPLVQFSSTAEVKDTNDSGDGGGVPVFAFLSIPALEKLAKELVQMFILELSIKRLIVVALLVTKDKAPQGSVLSWFDELYAGEFDELSACNLYSKVTNELEFPGLTVSGTNTPDVQPNKEILESYLLTWLVQVNLDVYRVDEIFDVVGEEINVELVRQSKGP